MADSVDPSSHQFQAALEQAKREALFEFAAGAGHEINNPVATIYARTRMLLKGESDPERRRMLSVIGGQALRIRDMIGDLMLFANPPDPQPESLDLSNEIADTIDKLSESIEERKCRVDFSPSDEIPIFADATQLRMVIGNLLRNSLDAMPDTGGKITVAAESVVESNGTVAVLSVTDSGCGLSKLDRRHLFDPYYSGRQAGRGLGFGLCKCWRIVSNHGGRIEVESENRQTSFRVFWPERPVDDTVV